MDVSIILINYKTPKLTLDAINSVIEKSSGFEYEIIVVDNSNDLAEFKQLSELVGGKAKLINAEANLGFGKGNNLGAKSASGEFLLFLNTDTLLINNAVFELFDFIKKHDNVGAVGANLFSKDGKPNHSYILKEKNLENEISENSLGKTLKRKLFKRDDFNLTNEPQKIDGYLCGASLMVRKSCFDEIGGFDSDIFMYGEDSLLCYKIINVCKKDVYSVPSAKIIHFEGGSVNSEISDFHAKMVVDGNYIYYKKAFGEETAKKYLEKMAKVYKKKAFAGKLLGMKTKSYNFKKMSEALKSKEEELDEFGKKILVTGVKGQLGFDVVKELETRGYKNVLGIDKDELDITDETAVNTFIEKYMPDVIIHCAAWTAVDKAEELKDLCFNVNVLGTRYIATVAEKIGAKLVYISTDYVFDGTGDKFFETYDKKAPLSVYGKTKLEGELEVKKCSKSFIVRTSWVFGKNGNNFVKTMLKLSETKTELNVVSDQIGSPTYTPDLAVLLCDMIKTEKYGIYHATNENVCSWAEFASKIFEIAKKNVKVNPVSTEEYRKIAPNQAPRPLNSRLSKTSLDSAGFKRLPSWQDALERYIKNDLEQ